MPQKAKKAAKPARKAKKRMSPQDFMRKFLQEKQEKIKQRDEDRHSSMHMAPVIEFQKPHQEMRYSKFAGPRRKAS